MTRRQQRNLFGFNS